MCCQRATPRSIVGFTPALFRRLFRFRIHIRARRDVCVNAVAVTRNRGSGKVPGRMTCSESKERDNDEDRDGSSGAHRSARSVSALVPVRRGSRHLFLTEGQHDFSKERNRPFSLFFERVTYMQSAPGRLASSRGHVTVHTREGRWPAPGVGRRSSDRH